MKFEESENIELKSEYTKNISKELIAFANSEGGDLYVGVNDKGEIIGLEYPDSTCLKISNSIRDSMKPDMSLLLDYETLEENLNRYLHVNVQEGTNKPYYLSSKGPTPSGVFVRQGFSTVPASKSAILRMIKETDEDSFENGRSIHQDLTFQSTEKEFKNRNIQFGDNQKRSLGLINGSDLYTNLGLLLSDQCIHTTKVAVYESLKQISFKDRREFEGSLFEQLEQIYNYIDLYNETHSTYDKLLRIDRRNYPEVAIREALLNALIHRDYSSKASTFISIFPDRIEFTSIGSMPKVLTEKDLEMGVSVCRNPKLANIFYRLELVEVYGTGIPKIMESYSEEERKPEIKVSDNVFKIILPNKNYKNSQIHLISTDNPEIENDSEEIRIFNLLRNNKSMSRREIESSLNMSRSTVTRLLKSMINKELIVRIGKGKNTVYQLKE